MYIYIAAYIEATESSDPYLLQQIQQWTFTVVYTTILYHVS